MQPLQRNKIKNKLSNVFYNYISYQTIRSVFVYELSILMESKFSRAISINYWWILYCKLVYYGEVY